MQQLIMRGLEDERRLWLFWGPFLRVEQKGV